MTIKRRFIILCLIIFISKTSYSNPKPLPGYYIKSNGDSVACMIDFPDWETNPATIIAEVNNVKQTFSPGDIKGFGVYGYCDYKSASISYHKNPVSGSDLPEEFSDKVDTAACFLKIIAQGYYSLYELIIPARRYFFVGKTDATPSELIYRVKQNEDRLDEDQQYKNQLFSIFTEEGIGDQYFNLINTAFYSTADFKKLVGKLNLHHPGVVSAPLKRPSNRLQVDVFAGGVLFQFPTALYGLYGTVYKMDPSFSLTGGINILYPLPNHFKSFALGLSAGYASYRYSTKGSGTSSFYNSDNWNGTTNYTEEVKTSNALLMGNVYAVYFINPLSKINFYIKGGLSFNVSLKQNRDIYNPYYATSETITNGIGPEPSTKSGIRTIKSIEGSSPNLNLDLGIRYQRHKFEFAYYAPSDIGQTRDDKFKVNTLGVYYYYTILR